MKVRKGIIGILVAVCLNLPIAVGAESKATILKLATLAPEGSIWMKGFHRVNQALQSRTGGTVKMRAYPGGIMGDDQAMLRKMRIGQIHIAGITGLGLASLCQDAQVLGTPFLFRNYAEVDHVLARLESRLESDFKDKGHVLVAWSEIGFIYMMSNKPITSLEDFQGTKVWMPEGDHISRAMFRKVGVSPVPLGIPDVLLALQTGLVDVVYSPPVGAIALQWFTKVRHITRTPLSYALGGIVMTHKAFERIPKEHQRAFVEVFRDGIGTLNTQTRNDNEEALRVMEGEGIQFVDLSPEELSRFKRIAQEATEEITGDVFSREIWEEVNSYLNDARQDKS